LRLQQAVCESKPDVLKSLQHRRRSAEPDLSWQPCRSERGDGQDVKEHSSGTATPSESLCAIWPEPSTPKGDRDSRPRVMTVVARPVAEAAVDALRRSAPPRRWPRAREGSHPAASSQNALGDLGLQVGYSGDIEVPDLKRVAVVVWRRPFRRTEDGLSSSEGPQPGCGQTETGFLSISVSTVDA
jgi:hypothetical protein